MAWQSGHHLGTALCQACTWESLHHANGSFWPSSRARPCRHGPGRHQSWTGRTGPCSSAVSARVHGDRDKGMGVVRLGEGLESNIPFWEDHQVLKLDPGGSHAQWKCPSGNGTCHFKLATRQRTDHSENSISKMEATSAGREQMRETRSASCSSILDALKLWIPLCGGWGRGVT